MDLKFENLGNGYLYNLWNGKLKEYYGEIVHRDGYVDHGLIYHEITRFVILNEQGKQVKILQCSCNEGEIQNKMVWFYDRNKSGAAKILIEYEENEIAKLEFRIRNHKEIIESLMKEIES